MPSSSAGSQLRKIRSRLGLTMRDVECISDRLATREGSDDFRLSHARLTQIERSGSTPSIHKLYTLSVAYGLSLTRIIALYLNVDAIRAHQLAAASQTTRLIEHEPDSVEDSIEVPIAFHESADLDCTTMVTELVKTWGHIPLRLMGHLTSKRCQYGLIGLKDYTMFPLLRPGAFVQISAHRKLPDSKRFLTEFDRPLYFIELRSGYLCSWCELKGDRLMAIPHPLSPCRMREFKYPADAHIVGRVTGVATPLHGAETSPMGARPSRAR